MMFDFTYGGCDIRQGPGGEAVQPEHPDQTEIKPNVERWNDPATDAGRQRAHRTTDKAEQKVLVGELVDMMMKQYPVTALIYAPGRILYRTDKAIGWPSEQDPYAQPGRRQAVDHDPPDAPPSESKRRR